MQNKPTTGKRASVRPANTNTPASVATAADAAKASQAGIKPAKASMPSAALVSPKPRKPRKSKGVGRKQRLEALTVKLSPGQARIVCRYAAVLRATPADMLAALALSEIASCDGAMTGFEELDSYNSALIEFVAQRRLPEDGSERLVNATHLKKNGGAE